MNKYAELRSRQQKEVNALPLGFAFSNRQFEEMMKGWGLDPEKYLDKIVSIGAGGYIQKKDRSLMNVPFVTGDADLDAEFVKAATAAGFVNLKGHRSVGGMRASIYNAMPIEGVEALVAFMKDFEEKHQ